MFKRFSTGNYTLEQIAALLRESGVKGIRGKTISPASVQRMLQNPIYYGVMRYKGELHDAVHEPLVTKKLFDRCQKVMSRRSRPKSKGLKPFLYRGLLRCSVCQGTVTVERQKGHVYLHCSKRKQPCKGQYRPAVREEAITEQIGDFLMSVSLPDEWVDEMLDRLAGEQEQLRKALVSKQGALKESKETLFAKADRAQEGWLDGVLPLSEYRSVRNRIVQERRELDEQIAELEQREGNRFEPMSRLLKASKQAKKVASEGTSEDKLDFFRKAGSNPQLVSRHLTCEPRGAWKLVQKPTLLANERVSGRPETRSSVENTSVLRSSGEGGIRSGPNLQTHEVTVFTI